MIAARPTAVERYASPRQSASEIASGECGLGVAGDRKVHVRVREGGEFCKGGGRGTKVAGVCGSDVAEVGAFVDTAVFPDADEAIEVGEIIGMKEQGVDHAENGDIGADAEGEDENGY